MLKTVHEAYDKAEEINLAIGEIFDDDNYKTEELHLEGLKNNLILCRAIKTTIELYEMSFNRDISILIAK